VAPDGTKLPLTVKSKDISVLKPTTTWDIDTGYFQPAALAGFFALLPAPGTGFPGGEYWHNGTISVPVPFAGGEGCFAQIITPDFEMFQDGSNLPHADPNNKVKGLDNQFPYVNYQWTLPAIGTQSDTPAIGVSGVNVPQYQGWNTATYTDQFSTWLMYRPPVVGSQSHVWVALETYGWSWLGTVQWVNNQWTITASNPSSTARAPARQINKTDDPPTWSFVQKNGP
jgi:hypothetical protein